MTMFDVLGEYKRHAHFEKGKWIDGMHLKICADDDPMDPREWDNLGHMICSHREYRLGDEQLDTSEFSSWDEVEEWLEAERGAVIILPLYLFDHSGLSLSTSSSRFRACDSMGWDWGQIGFIYVTFDEMQKNYGDTLPDSMDKAERVLIGEVEEYGQYLSGEVYGFTLEDEHGEELDSCWGFYHIDHILEHVGMNKSEEV